MATESKEEHGTISCKAFVFFRVFRGFRGHLGVFFMIVHKKVPFESGRIEIIATRAPSA